MVVPEAPAAQARAATEATAAAAAECEVEREGAHVFNKPAALRDHPEKPAMAAVNDDGETS